MTFAAAAGLAAIAAAFLSLVYLHPVVLALIGVVALVTIAEDRAQSRRLARLAADRHGESICSFAWSFDYRSIDTWIIRAVHEELQPYCRFGRQTLPLRATDDLTRDLRIDPDDLDGIAVDVADRTGRSMDGCDANPLYGKVKTVADLVAFLMRQPST